MATVIGLLAALSASAAAGMRIGLPLLIIGLLRSDLWSSVPWLSYIHPQVLLAILTSWSLFELLSSKNLLGQRVMQLIQLICSPIVGALLPHLPHLPLPIHNLSFIIYHFFFPNPYFLLMI